MLEVLAAVTILSIAAISFTLLFTKNYEFSHQEEKRNVSLQVARTVIEELKTALPTSSAQLTLFGQAVNLTSLRDQAQNTAPAPLFYPAAGDRQYEILITDLPIPANQSFPIQDAANAAKSYNFAVNAYFSFIQVQVRSLTTDEQYTLQRYIERNEATP